MLAPTAPKTRSLSVWTFCRRCVYCTVTIVCSWTFVHVCVFVEFQVPTGSMAPTLLGNHRVGTCSRCGQQVPVGRHYADATGSGQTRFYRKSFCPNCGQTPLDLAGTEEIRGDRVVVNRAAYLLRTPARWEIVVLRLFGTHYIKRLLGLPGEVILIQHGDLYVNGQLQRKTLAQAKQMRVRIYDQANCPPMTMANSRWAFDPAIKPDDRGALAVDGTMTPSVLTYRNISLETGKCEPLRDEYAYNAGLHADSACVHDFMIEMEVEVTSGAGSLAMRLCDGHDWVEVHLPFNAAHPSEAFAWPVGHPEMVWKLADATRYRAFCAGQRYRMAMAFVDRRLSLTMDDQLLHQIDLPETKDRKGVECPFQLHANGVRVTLHSFRLYRDVHYGQQGKQAVHGKMVRLGVDQFFVLGDNSPHSEDSRHWPDEGRVDIANLIGPIVWAR